MAVNYAGNATAAEKEVTAIKNSGGSADAFKADIADTNAVGKMFDSIQTTFGGVDVVVNSAGILRLARVEETSDEMFDELLNIKLKGAFNVLRQAAKQVRAGGG